MATKISELTAATTPLSASDVFWVEQSGPTQTKVSIGDLDTRYGVDTSSFASVDQDETITGAWVFSRAGESLSLKDPAASGNDASAGLSFYDSLDARMGFVGFGSTANADLRISSEGQGGGIKLRTAATDRLEITSAGVFDFKDNPLENIIFKGGVHFDAAGQQPAFEYDQDRLVADFNLNGSRYWGMNGYANGDFGFSRYLGSGSFKIDAPLKVPSLIYLGNSTLSGIIGSGQRGSVQVSGDQGAGWAGYSIGGEAVFMWQTSQARGGLYNDLTNSWFLQGNMDGNDEVALFYNGNQALTTTTNGAAFGHSSTAPLSPGFGALIGDNDRPYLSFHQASGDRGAYIEHVNASRLAINCEEGYIDFYTNGANDMRLETDGDLHVEGNVVANSSSISDARHKEDLRTILAPIEKLTKLTGYHFRWIKDGRWDVGLIAQEVEAVLPHLVSNISSPCHGQSKAVSYDGIHALTIEAVKAQQEQIESQKTEIVELKKAVSAQQKQLDDQQAKTMH